MKTNRDDFAAVPSNRSAHTPRTDALIQNGPLVGDEYWVELWDGAINSHRQLETELAAAKAINAELLEALQYHAEQVYAQFMAHSAGATGETLDNVFKHVQAWRAVIKKATS